MQFLTASTFLLSLALASPFVVQTPKVWVTNSTIKIGFTQTRLPDTTTMVEADLLWGNLTTATPIILRKLEARADFAGTRYAAYNVPAESKLRNDYTIRVCAINAGSIDTDVICGFSGRFAILEATPTNSKSKTTTDAQGTTQGTAQGTTQGTAQGAAQGTAQGTAAATSPTSSADLDTSSGSGQANITSEDASSAMALSTTALFAFVAVAFALI